MHFTPCPQTLTHATHYAPPRHACSRAITSTEELLSLLTAPKLSADKQSKGMFLTTISFLPDGISFTPDAMAVLEELNGTVESVISIAQQAPRLVFMRTFAQYFDGKPSGLNPPAIIRNTPHFQQLREQVRTAGLCCGCTVTVLGLYWGCMRSAVPSCISGAHLGPVLGLYRVCTGVVQGA